jgi:DNA-binding Xre family transcriptional regulator
MTDLPKPMSITKDRVVLTRAAWNALIEKLEDAEDRAAIRNSRTRTKSDEALPVDLYRRIRAGEHPVRIWRQHRKLGLNVLAQEAAIARGYLSEIETGKKPGSAAALQRIARALNIDMDEIVSPRP